MAETKVTLQFEYDRTTKRTIRFSEVPSDAPPIVGILYVQKWWAGDAKELTVTLEKEEEN